MAETSIPWCDYTYNEWRGCEKVSPACANCYAEVGSHRNPKALGEWGPGSRRAMAAESYRRQLDQWNEAAAAAGERRSVFCLSLGDIFEDREDLDERRAWLFHKAQHSTALDFLFLSKRPELAPAILKRTRYLVEHPHADWWELQSRATRPNFAFGTSIDNEEYLLRRVPHLRAIPAVMRFLSIEPLLGRIRYSQLHAALGNAHAIDWIIVGGESFRGGQPLPTRPFDLDWAREIRDFCFTHKIAFFMKQGGSECRERGKPLKLVHKKGEDLAELPEDLRIRQLPIWRHYA